MFFRSSIEKSPVIDSGVHGKGLKLVIEPHVFLTGTLANACELLQLNQNNPVEKIWTFGCVVGRLHVRVDENTMLPHVTKTRVRIHCLISVSQNHMLRCDHMLQ